MPFVSRRQQKWAFSTHQPFAKRWAKQTDFASLPASKDAGADAGAPLHGPGGLLATPGMGKRTVLSSPKGRKKWGVRTKATQIVGNLYRGDTGKFQAGSASTPSATPRRGDVLSKQPKPAARPKPAKVAAPKKGGGKKAAAAKKPKQTPDEKRAAHEAAQAQNRQQVLAKMNIAPDGQAALEALRGGAQPDPAAVARGGFEQAGLVERAQDGSYRLSASGRALVNAASSGDAGRAGDIISAARDRTSARGERQQAAAERHRAAEQRHAEMLARRAALEKKRMRTKAVMSAADQNDLPDSAFLFVESGGKKDTDGKTVPRSLRHFPYKDANGGIDLPHLRNAIARIPQSNAKGLDKAALQKRAQSLLARANAVSEKSFTVFKDHTGAHRWIARTTTAYLDRDKEIIASDALDADSQRMATTKQFGPLRYWHVGSPDPFDQTAPWGPGLDIGDCDYSTLIGRTRIESGTFRDPKVAQTIATKANQYELSPGFFHPLDQPDQNGVFHAIRTFERSIVPVKYGRASNLFTGLAVKESRMDIDEMERRFKTAVTDLGLDKDQALVLGQQLVATEKTATQQGIAFKSDEQPATGDVRAAMGEPQPVYVAADGTQGMIINGLFSPLALALKAAPPPLDAEDDPTLGGDMGADEAAEGEPPLDDMGGDVIGNMTPDEFKAMLADMLAPVLKMQDMVKSIGDMHGELKGMYGGVAQKDDARAAELTALKAQYAELAQKIATIEGDQPAVVLTDEVEAALKSAGPAAPAEPENPAIVSAVNDPSRPWAAWGIQTFPELYKANGQQ